MNSVTGLFFKTAAISLLLAVSLYAEGEKERAAGPKFLVLGFDSKQINGIQGRFLREKILWDLQKSGYAIVPVMDFEKFFGVMGEEALKKPGEKNIKRYSEKFNADYVMTGKIYPRGSDRPGSDIKTGTTYACEVILYDRNNNRSGRLSFDIEGREDYFIFFTELSQQIIKEVTAKIPR